MKLYVSEFERNLDQFDVLLKDKEIVKNIEESTDVLVVPGGMGAFSDIFKAKELEKNLYIYNKDMYYSDLINNLYKGHIEGYIDDAPSAYMHIESDINNIIKDMEEKENGKTDNGEISKLL